MDYKKSADTDPSNDQGTIMPSPRDSRSSSIKQEEQAMHQTVVKEFEKEEVQELDHPVHELLFDTEAERDVEAIPHPKEKPAEKDPFLVGWDGPADKNDPKNWTKRRKWAAVFVVSSFTFISPVSSSMVAPALPILGKELNIKTDFARAMVLSIFVLAYAIGPMLFAPLSEGQR